MKLFAAALVAGLLVAQAVAAEDFSVKVGKDFTEGTFEWDSGLGTGYVFQWSATVHNGLIAICGVGQYPNSHTQMASKDLLRKAVVSLGGKPILKDLRFFARAPMTEKLGSATANCRDTKTKAPNGRWEVRMETQGRARF